MGLSFSQFLVVNEVFRLDHGRVLTLAEIIYPQSSEEPFDAKTVAQQQIAAIPGKYKPGPGKDSDHIVAAVVGLKPTAIIRYDHHPDSPAAAVVSDEIKKKAPTGNAGAIQAELLKHGIQVRPDFHIIHMNLPGYTQANIIIGGRKDAEELWSVLKCQYYLDMVSSDDHQTVTPELMVKVNSMMNGQCQVFCKPGEAGINCKPLHRRIGQLLGYTDEQVDTFLAGMTPDKGGYDYMPDVQYPFELPPSLAAVPKKKGFIPNESRYKSASFVRVFR